MLSARLGLLVVISVGPLFAATNSAKPVVRRSIERPTVVDTVECGATLTRSATLDADLVCGTSALIIATPGVVLNCAGHSIRGIPGGVAIQVTATNVAVNDCTIDGFSAGIQALDASGLKVARNRFSNLNSPVRVNTSRQVVLVENFFESSLGSISMSDCPQAVVERNEFVPLERHVGIINLLRCPNSRISRNRSTQGVAVAVWRASDDSIVSNNSLGGRGRVSVGFSSRVKVTHNSAGGLGPTHSGNLFGADLTGATDCAVAHNEFTGVGIFVFGSTDNGPDGSTILLGADDNRVHDNQVEGAVWGILVFGGSRNLIARNAFSGCEIGIGAFPLINGETLPVTPSTDNEFLNNALDGGSYGIYTANAGGNRYEENLVRGFAIGVSEVGTVPAVSPDSFRNNVIADNDYFGLLAQGASPTIFGNVFERNGGADQPPGLDDLFPLGELIGSARGGIGLFPFTGADPSTLDDGDPSNDKLSEPLIGALDEPNVFADNTFADIYALDTRATNTSELLTSNQFQSGGTAARVQQDWFGLVRVALPDGSPAAGAAVELTDALGRPVATVTTGSDGVAPNDCDPTRPMGRLPGEEGGPTPQWLRITEYIVDRDGNRIDSTPHHISVQGGGLSGNATYAWTGCSDAGCEVLRRYQIADVTLGPRSPLGRRASQLTGH